MITFFQIMIVIKIISWIGIIISIKDAPTDIDIWNREID